MGTLKHRCARLRAAPLIFALLVAMTFALANKSVAQPLTLNDAFLRAAEADPALPAAQARINAAEAGIRQAGTKPCVECLIQDLTLDRDDTLALEVD